MGLPKSDSLRERLVIRTECAIAIVFLLATIGLTETGCVLWAQLLSLALVLLCCGLAGLVETASDWQREISRGSTGSTRGRNG